MVDTSGNVGVYNTTGGGGAVGTGLSGSLSLTAGASSAQTIWGFGGPFVEVGGNAGLGAEAGATGYYGYDADGSTPVYGGSVNAGISSPGVGTYADMTKTWITPLFGRKCPPKATPPQ